MNYRKLVTSFYNGYPKSVVYYWKNHCKKVSPHENPKENFLHWNLKRKIFHQGVSRGEFRRGSYSDTVI